MVDYDLGVISRGPGGYVAAIQTTHLEQKTACVELLTGKHAQISYYTIPGIRHPDPNGTSTGQTKGASKDVRTDGMMGQFAFMADARSRSTGKTVGVIKEALSRRAWPRDQRIREASR